jgi:hypothetical protein
MHPARYDVIAGAFRSWFGENRRFDLEKSAFVEEATGRLLQPMPKDDVVLELGPAKIEVSVFQAQLLCRQLLSTTARYWDRRSFGWAHDFYARRAKLDVTSLHLGISHLGGSLGDFTVDDDDGFQSESSRAIDCVSRRPFGVERDLNEPGAVAKVDEHNAAEISGSMNPAAELDLRADVGGSELTTQVSAPGGREGG